MLIARTRRVLGWGSRVALLGMFMLGAFAGQAQLVVTPQTDLQELARAISGPGVQVANPVIVCHAQGFGEFTYSGSVLGVGSGVLLTSGTIANAIGPNSVENRTFQAQTPGSALLNTVTGRTTYDACRFEFDVIPGGDTLRFNFAFASEEYNEWVGSQYNDVFGFFISGPGIAGDPGIAPEKNIALIPNTAQAVTINNVNNGSNQGHYHDNVGGQHIQYDGITQGLQAVAVVQPCQTYRLKLIVADASDRKFDSGVFVERISSNAVTMEAFTVSGFPNIIEGCNPGIVRFTRQTVTNEAWMVPFFLMGQSVNGLDYPQIGDADPQVAKTAIIPAGQTHVDVTFDAFADGIAEGIENIRVYLGSSICPGFYLDSLDLFIQDSLFSAVNPPVSICPGASVQLSAAGGLVYNWSPATGLNNSAVQAPMASPASTTTYSVTVSAGGCTSVLNTTVTVSSMSLAAVVTKPLCQGQTNGAINLSVSGGTPPFTFAWSGPNGFSANTEDLVNAGAGTYTVTVNDGTGCTRVQSFNVGAPAALTATLAPSILPFGQNISCFGGSDGSIDLTISGGTAPYTINWTGPNGFTSSSEGLNGLPAGTYAVIVTDVNGCTAMGDRTLTQPPALTPTIGDVVNVSCHGATSGTATAAITGGIPPYSFQWNTPPVQNSPTAIDLPAGNHTVTISDGYGCTAVGQVTISAPAAPLNVSITNVNQVIQCQGQATPSGSATATATGGSGNYTYSWNTNPEQITSTASFTTGGTYTVTVSDANGCQTSAQVTVAQPGQAAASITAQTNVSCAGGSNGSATVNISGGANVTSITWNTTPPQTGITANGLSAGNYTVTAQHSDGCQTTTNVLITGPTLLQAVISDQMNVVCAGSPTGSATAVGNGGAAPYTYSWNTEPIQSQATATALSSGTHLVTITDANGCAAQAQVTIQGPSSALAVNITGFTNVLCFETAQGTAQALSAGGTAPYSYSWNTTPQQSTSDAIDLPEGTWTVSVTDDAGCSASANVVIGGPQFGIFGSFESITHVSCFGANDGAATVTVYGGSNSFTVNWDTQPPVTGFTATGLTAGTYTVEMIDNNGCDTPKFGSVEILGPASPLALELAVTPATCSAAADGSIDLTISGGELPYTTLWSDQAGNTTGLEDLIGLDVDTYFLTAHDAYGCVIDTMVTISATDALGISANVMQELCSVLSYRFLNAFVLDGEAPFTFTWSGPAGYSSSDASIANVGSGQYTVIVEDGNGCSASTTIELSGSLPPTIDLEAYTYIGGTNTSCAGSADGAVDLGIQGGTAPYSIAWTDGLGFSSSNEDIMGVGAGVYQVIVTDANGCEVSDFITLTSPTALFVQATITAQNGYEVSCANGSDGNLDITISGGTAPYSQIWNNGNTGTLLSGIAAGTWSVEITDANGCTTESSYLLSAPDPIAAEVDVQILGNGSALSCAGGDDGSLSTTITGGVAPYNLEWSGPNNYSNDSADLQGLLAGNYHLVITDDNGCVLSTTVAITHPQPIAVQLTTTTLNGGVHIACTGSATGTISASVNGGSGALNLQWSGPNGFSSDQATLSGLTAGTYQVVATDAYGCSGTASLTLTEADVLEVELLLTQIGGYELSCAGNDGSIALNITGGTPVYGISWNGPNGFGSTLADNSGLVAGEYHVVVTDANGCLFEGNVDLNPPPALMASFTNSVVNCSGGSGDITLLVTGGSGTIVSQTWTGPNGFTSQDASVSNVPGGTYSVTIEDDLGCVGTFTTTLDQPAPLMSGTYVSQYGNYNISCAGDSTGVIDLSPNGGTAPYVVVVNGPNGYSSTALAHGGLHAGNYQVLVTDANGCAMDTTITLVAPEVGISAMLDVSLYPSGTNISCHGASDGWINASVIGGEGPFTFFWRGPDSLEFVTPFIDGLPAGDYAYELVVTDANECSFFTEITLIEPAVPLEITATLSEYLGGYQVSCGNNADGSISLSTSGGNGTNVVLWSGPNGFISTDLNISDLAPGNYTATITDMNGCTAEVTVSLEAPVALQSDLQAFSFPGGSSISCQGANDGSISASIIGGVPEYVLNWIGPDGFTANDPAISGLAPGTYCLEVVDANGCAVTSCFTLMEPEVLNASIDAASADCGQSIGAVDLSITGGSAPYSYLWNNGSNMQDLNGLAPGTFSVLVTDANGCTTNAEAVVTGTAGVLALGTASHVLCNGNSTGELHLEVTSGTAPFGIAWSNGGSGTHLQGLSAGSYTAEITDANGCTFIGSWSIHQADAITIGYTPSLYASGHNISTYQGSNGSITTQVSGGTPPYTYAWSTGSPTAAMYNLPAGTYVLEVTDANGCSALLTVILTGPNDLEMPTGFSPNGDGANDSFIIRGLEAYPANTFVVLNRWGNVVYDRLNYRNDWRGENAQGQDLPNGTYFAILKVAEGTRTLQGYVDLRR